MLWTNLVVFALLFPLISSLKINDQICEAQLAAFDEALRNRDQWALFVFDTWAKFQSGISRGNRVIPGSFSDCVNFRQQLNLTEGESYQGKHCMVFFSAKEQASEINREDGFDWREIGSIARDNSFTFYHGFCLPATCSNEKVLEYMNGYLNHADFHGSYARCQTNDPVPFEPLDIFAIVFFSTIALLMTASTLYEIWAIRKERTPHQLYTTFSVYISGYKLHDVTISKSKSDIRCLHGIRALSIIYIIFGHRYGIPLFGHISNSAFAQEWSKRFYIGIYHTHQVPVDVFFLMGGLLMTMSTLKSLDSGRLNLFRMYLRRWLRYTPLLAAIVLFFITFMKHIVFSPMSYLEGGMWNMVPNCQKWWWTTLLHIQNYVNPTEICLSHTWYLSIDFQMFLISPILLYPAWKFGWKYLWALPTLAFMTSIYVYIVAIIPGALEFWSFIRWIYYPTHARMGPWLLGMTLGYIFHQNRDKKLKISPVLNTIMWILTLTIFAAITMGSQIIFFPAAYNNTGVHAHALYTAFYRNGWALASAWMIFACHNGTGGIIRWFLQLPQWQPIGRMGLSMYLLGFIFQHFIFMNSKQPYYFDEIELFHQFWGDLLATIFLSTIGYLAFEAPPMAVEDYVYRKIHDRKKEKSTRI